MEKEQIIIEIVNKQPQSQVPTFSSGCKIGTMMFVGSMILVGGIIAAVVLTSGY